MAPIDKTSEKQKEDQEKQDDLRYEWSEEDIQDANRKPNLGELDADPDEME